MQDDSKLLIFINEIFNFSVNWDAVAAVSTLAATIVALFASWLAIKVPEWSRNAERLSATHEILLAVQETVLLFYGARKLAESSTWDGDLVSIIRIRSSHLYVTIDRLISRPYLSDGAIAVGAGAMSVLDEIKKIPTAAEIFEKNRNNKRGLYDPGLAKYVQTISLTRQIISSIEQIVDVVKSRASRVEKYYGIKPYPWDEVPSRLGLQEDSEK